MNKRMWPPNYRRQKQLEKMAKVRLRYTNEYAASPIGHDTYHMEDSPLDYL